MVVQVVLAADSALPYMAVHARRRHERQPRAREHDRRCRLLRRVGDPRSTRNHRDAISKEIILYDISNEFALTR